MAQRTVHPHGTPGRYTYNACRCAECRAAHTEDFRRMRRAIAYGRWEGLLDATGTHRRVRALAATGWSLTYLAQRRGVGSTAVENLASGKNTKVMAHVARAYAEIYDELCNEDGPSLRARTWARKKGWHGPEAWTDETIDDPAARPFAVAVFDEEAVKQATSGRLDYGDLGSTAERLEAYRRLVDSGAGSGTIRNRLNISGSTLSRLIKLARTAEQTQVAA